MSQQDVSDISQAQIMAIAESTNEASDTRCRETEDALRESESCLRAIVETAVDGIVTIDERGSVTSLNPAAVRMFGYLPEELLGKNVSLLMPAPYRDEHDGYLQNYRATRIKKVIGSGREVVFRRKDGTQFPADLAVSETVIGGQKAFTGIVRELTERKRAQQIQANLAAIVESSDDAIIGKTLDGIITSWNKGAERLFEFPAADIIGLSVLTLIPPDRQHEEADIQQRLRAGERIDHFETVRLSRSGRLVDVSLTVSPIRDAAGRITGASKIVRDVTQRKRSEAALARQAEELARSNVELERFAYVASHDLQEPMRTVRSFAQLLERRAAGGLSGEAAEYLKYITGGVERMQKLINDLLAYSRVSSMGSNFAPADCGEIFRNVLANLQASIETHNADVSCGPLPVVLGDATQLGQVFQNLLINAIKFRGDVPPKIRVSAVRGESGWAFSVKDNGIGISPKYFDRIFIIFQRLHTIEEYPGTGIGLAICKKIVERHGGAIRVESAAGEGAVFTFTIPNRRETA